MVIQLMLVRLFQASELMNARQGAGIGLALVLVTGSSVAQNGTMMNGGRSGGWMGGYSGYWIAILVLVIVVGLVVWVIKQQKK